jgi:hypothetical protein
MGVIRNMDRTLMKVRWRVGGDAQRRKLAQVGKSITGGADINEQETTH